MAETTKRNPNLAKPLTELLLVKLADIEGLPNWAVTKCCKAGVKTVGDLYRMQYLDAARTGFGPKFGVLAEKMLTRLGLVERIGLRDPIIAVAREAEIRTVWASEDAIPQRLAEHEALVLADCDRKLADTDNFYRDKLIQLTKNFRRRERILSETLTKVTREEFVFTARNVSPESAARWLALHTAGHVQDGFKFEAELECLTRSQLLFKRTTEMQLSAKNVARLLVVFGERKDELVNAQGRFAPSGSMVGQGCEGIETTVAAMFVGRSGGQLAMLEGMVVVAGMSDNKIKDLLRSPEPERMD